MPSFLQSLFGGGDERTKTDSETIVQGLKSADSIKSSTEALSTERGTVAASQATTGTEQVTTQKQLPQAVQDALTQFIQGRIGAVTPSPGQQGLNLSSALATRAGGTQEFVDERIGNIVGAARLEGEDTIRSQETQAATQSGSALNTLVADIGQRSRNDLETKLAGLSGQLEISGRELESTDFATALAGLNDAERFQLESILQADTAKASNVSQLTDALRGATSVGTTTGLTEQSGRTEEQETINRLAELLDVIVQREESTTEQRTTGTQSADSSGSILALLDVLSGF